MNLVGKWRGRYEIQVEMAGIKKATLSGGHLFKSIYQEDYFRVRSLGNPHRSKFFFAMSAWRSKAESSIVVHSVL